MKFPNRPTSIKFAQDFAWALVERSSKTYLVVLFDYIVGIGVKQCPTL